MAENLAFLPAINTLDDPNPVDYSANFYVYGYNGESVEDERQLITIKLMVYFIRGMLLKQPAPPGGISQPKMNGSNWHNI
jgi:hypothetical protein